MYLNSFACFSSSPGTHLSFALCIQVSEVWPELFLYNVKFLDVWLSFHLLANNIPSN